MMINYLQLQPNWNVSYSIYVDDLHIFKNDVYSKKSSDLVNKKFKNYTIVCDKATLEPVLIEMKQASRHIDELDNMSQIDIINSIERYINAHAEVVVKQEKAIDGRKR